MTHSEVTVFISVTHYHRGSLQQAIDRVCHHTRPGGWLRIVVDEDRRPHFPGARGIARREI